jgi:hypothetical protein
MSTNGADDIATLVRRCLDLQGRSIEVLAKAFETDRKTDEAMWRSVLAIAMSQDIIARLATPNTRFPPYRRQAHMVDELGVPGGYEDMWDGE